MSGEIIAVITVRVTLAGLILTSFRSLRSGIAGLRERMAHLEGFREAISGRVT